MRCGECEGEMISLHGTMEIVSNFLGSYQLHNVDFWECLECHDRILPAETWTAADREEERLIKEKVGRLPVIEFLSASETANILGMTRQALHKHRRISRGFVYTIVIDGKRLYHRGSLERFMRIGDGRFLLGGKQIVFTKPLHEQQLASTSTISSLKWQQASQIPTSGGFHEKRVSSAH